MTRMALRFMLASLALAGAAHAQILTGDLIGAVRDESGAVLPGVTVTLASPALPAGPLTLVTSASGEYRFTQLAAGTYDLTATLSGFSTYAETGLRVAVGGTIERNVTLTLAAVAETITVSGESPMVDPRRVGTQTNLPQETLEILPNHRYYFTEYGKWAPGVSTRNPSAGGQSDLSVMGSGTDENTFMYDGVVADRPTAGGPFSSGDHDAVEEVQVSTLGNSAEYPGAQGGVFNVVFKQGTNDFRFEGSAFWFPDRLTSKPITINCRCPLGETGYTSVMYRHYSGHVGGPIKKDHLWFFGGAVYNTRIQVPPGTDPEPLRDKRWYSHKSLGKLTWQITDKVKFSQLYHNDPYGGQATPTIARPFETLVANYGLVQNYASEVTVTIANDTLLTARATGFVGLHYPSKPLSGDRVTPFRNDARTGLACCGVPQFNDQSIGRHGQSAKVNRYVKGDLASHDLRFGVQFERASYNSATAFPSGVQYSDQGGAPDQATFRDAFVQGAEYTSQAVWAEDQVTLGNRLTLSAGVRFDRMHAVSPDLPAVNNSLEKTGATIDGLGDMHTWNVVSPRTGFNFKLTDDGKTILRGSYGRGYRQIFLDDFIIVHPGLSPITLTRWNPATSSYSTIISVTDPLANIAVDPDIEAPFTDQFSLGVDRELMPNVGFSATFVHKRGEKRIGWADVGGVYGTRDEVLPDGRTITVFPLLNSPRDRRFLRTNGPGTFNEYDGVVMALTKRMSSRWQATVSYTYSQAEGLLETGQDPNDQVNATGRLPLDRPHMFTTVMAYEIPKIDVLVTGNLMAISGIPLAPQALVSLPQGRRSVNIESPGDYRLPSVQMLFLRVGKILRRGNRRVELSAEVMNALQDTAAEAIQTRNFYAANFGQPSSWVEPRRVQLLVRFKL